MANGLLDPYGTWGSLNRYIGTTKPDLSKLPPEIAAQLQDQVQVDEGGNQTHNYGFNQNPWGGFRGPDGQYYVQVGDPNSNNASDGGIKDKSKVTYQPGAGYVTTPDNLNDHGIGGIDWRMVAAVVGAGLGGAALGVGADAAGGAGAGAAGSGAAGSGAGGLTMTNTGLSGLFAGTPELAPATAQYAAAGAFGGAAGGATGSASGGLLSGAGGGSEGSGGLLGSGAGTGGMGGGGAAAETPWYQPAMNYVTNNPMNALRLGAGLYSMATANNQNPGAQGSGSGPSGPGGVTNTQGMATYNPLQAMGQFQQNPMLLQQMGAVPFMTGANRAMGFLS